MSANPFTFIKIREHMPWGRCDVYRDLETGSVWYDLDGALVTWAEMREYLAAEWIPQSGEDIVFFMSEIQGRC